MGEDGKKVPPPTEVSSTATDGSIAISGGGNTINETSLILRFLSIIEEQNRTIARLQDELLRLSGLRLKENE